MHTVGKPAKGAKPAPAKHAPHKARTTTAKTTARAKGQKASSKHTATKKTAAKPRGLALDGLPLCSLEAVAQSLRLLGQPVAPDEVAWLWESCGSRVLSIPEALEAAARFGLARCRPEIAEGALGTLYTGPGSALGLRCMSSYVAGFHSAPAINSEPPGDTCTLRALILGVDVPGPHAVLATPAGWWSWGQRFDPWRCAIEEVWEVAWSGR